MPFLEDSVESVTLVQYQCGLIGKRGHGYRNGQTMKAIRQRIKKTDKRWKRHTNLYFLHFNKNLTELWAVSHGNIYKLTQTSKTLPTYFTCL